MVRKRGERQTETETKRQRQRDRETDRQRDKDKDRETEHEKNNCETNDIILDTFTSTREVRGMNIINIYIFLQTNTGMHTIQDTYIYIRQGSYSYNSVVSTSKCGNITRLHCYIIKQYKVKRCSFFSSNFVYM